MELVTPNLKPYHKPVTPTKEQAMGLQAAELPGSAALARRAAEAEAAHSLMKVSFTGDAVEISGHARDQATVDQLIRALQAMRPLLPEAKPATKKEAADDPFEGMDDDEPEKN